MTKIAFIGLGAMGGAMAMNLQRKRPDITVYDIVPACVEPLVAAGARGADSLANAVADAGVVFTMLPATQHVEAAATGPEGIIARMKPGGLWVEMSTIAPAGTDRLRAAAAAGGVRFMDAPVGRLVSHAVAGESMFMIGCDAEADFDEARPLLEAMGTTILRCGPAGSGIRAKIVNNFQILTIAQVTAEALVLGTRLGLSVDTMRAVNGQTTASNGQMQVNFPSKVLVGDTAPGFTFDLAQKDLRLALDAATDLRLGLPVGAAASAVYGAARSGAYAGRDFSALLDYASALAGIEPPRLTTEEKAA